MLFLSIFNGKVWYTAKECQTIGTYTSTLSSQENGNLRTPKHTAYPAGGKDMYNVRAIIAERWHHGHIQYLVHGQWYNVDDDTWEPLAHLSDAVEYVARWNKEKKKRDVEAEVERQKKKQKAKEECLSVQLFENGYQNLQSHKKLTRFQHNNYKT